MAIAQVFPPAAVPATPARRRLLGLSGFSQRSQVYLQPDCIEIDEASSVDIRRLRIYYDDIVQVSACRRLNAGALVTYGLSSAVLGVLALILMSQGGADASPFSTLAGLASLGMLGAFFYKLAARDNAIHVVSRRKSIDIRLRRRNNAEAEFNALVARVSQAIAELQARVDAERPPPVIEKMPQQPPLPPAWNASATPGISMTATDASTPAQVQVLAFEIPVSTAPEPGHPPPSAPATGTLQDQPPEAPSAASAL